MAFLLSLILLAAVQPPLAISKVQTSETGKQESQTVSDGVEHLRITRGHKSEAETTGPWQINLLRVDLSKVDLRIVHALDTGIGLETTSSIAARYGAIAAVNGGYFRTTGTYRGESSGALQLDGRMISEPLEGRAAVGLIKRGERTEIIFGHLRFSGVVKTARGASFAASGINRPRAANEVIVYTPEFHRTTLTTPDGVEAVVSRGRVAGVFDKRGSRRVPADGYVISASGTARDWALKNLRSGSRVSLEMNLIASDGNQTNLWKRACCIVGGGPQLIKNGRVEITDEAEKIGQRFVTDRHPRTAIAKLKTGRLLFVAVDGRQPGLSVGMSLTELAELLLEFGAEEAINLDGGGSTTMVVSGRVVNNPSDSTGERAVSDSILIVPRDFKRQPKMD